MIINQHFYVVFGFTLIIPLSNIKVKYIILKNHLETNLALYNMFQSTFVRNEK